MTFIGRVVRWLRDCWERRHPRDEHLWASYQGKKVCAYCDCVMTRRNRHERCRSNAFFRVYLHGRQQ